MAVNQVYLKLFNKIY